MSGLVVLRLGLAVALALALASAAKAQFNGCLPGFCGPLIAASAPVLTNLRITNTGAFRITNTSANRAVFP